MASSKNAKRVARRLADTIERFERNGYEVDRNPAPISLAIGHKSFLPDLVARKGNEIVVIEVKSTKELKEDSSSYDVATQVSKMINWRYELVVSNPLTSSDESEPSNQDVPARRIEDALHLIEIGQIEAALLIGLAAVEGMLLQALDEESIKSKDVRGGLRLAKLAYFNGLISASLYRGLEGQWRRRNKIIHGGVEELSPEAVKRLLIEVRDQLWRG